MKRFIIGTILLVGWMLMPKAFAVEDMKPGEPVRFLDYQYWKIMNPGESCNFTPECDRNENCMEDKTCSPLQCDDTHKCVVGEKCDTGFCHV